MLSENSRKAVGSLGERLAALELDKAGYCVGFARIGEKRGDLRVKNPKTGEVMRIEVKTARQGRGGRWKFNLVKKGCTGVRHADVLVLLAVLKSGRAVHFIIPVEELGSVHNITISSHPEDYAGHFSTFRRHDWRLD